jgi:hypothetical protein
MDDAAGLFFDGLGKFGVGMPENQAHHAGADVVIFITVDIDELRSSAAREDHSWLIAPSNYRRAVARDKIHVMAREIEG